MNEMLLLLGRIAGIAGALLCVGAIAIRAAGQYWLGGFQVGTLLLAGSAAMVGGCLCFLWVIAGRLGTTR
ncbi:MAG TPA: hypothetical protein VGK44_12345 [Casimicrobiaceae bacterium]|jgi:hypothetical protein